MDCCSVTSLIDPLRRHLSDTSVPYTYSDTVLEGYLLDAVKALGPRWHNKYYVGTCSGTPNQVIRNTTGSLFVFSSPPVIQAIDERPIVLQASIIIKKGSKWSSVSSGDIVNWRDEEISYSNVESARQRSSTLQDDIDELEKLLPSTELARPVYERLKGWSKDWE